MGNMERLKSFLKATLPIVEDPELEVVIDAAIVLAMYYGKLSKKDVVTDEQFQSACAMIVAGFDHDSIHHLEECIKEFKEEVF